VADFETFVRYADGSFINPIFLANNKYSNCVMAVHFQQPYEFNYSNPNTSVRVVLFASRDVCRDLFTCSRVLQYLQLSANYSNVVWQRNPVQTAARRKYCSTWIV
jgi:hypothetical protein